MIGARAKRALESGIVWDNHACMPQSLGPDCLDALERYRRAGVTAVHVNIGDADMALETQVLLAKAYRSFIASHPDEYVLALACEDITRARETGRLAVAFDVEGAHAIGADLSVVRLYHELGVRWMLLVYNRANAVGAGCHDEVDEGLTPFGRALARELDAAGIVKDCSHTGYRTARDVLEESPVPVNFSHSNPRALHDHPRNIPDELILACARTGGVIGISGVGIFLGDNDTNSETFVRHVNYVAELAGPQHVGLGLDFVADTGVGGLNVDGSPHFWPPGFGYEPGVKFLEPERVPQLAELLVRSGYGDAELRGILGGNFFRVARRIWK